MLQKSKARATIVIRQLGSLALIALIASYLDFQQLVHLAARIKPVYLVLVIVFLVLERFVIAARWPILLHIKGHHISVWAAFKIDLISSFFAMAFPSLAANDAIRGYKLFRHTADLRTSLSSIVLDRIIGFVTLGLTAVVSLVIGWRTFGAGIAMAALGGFILFGTMAYFITTSPRTIQAPEHLFPSLQASKIWRSLSLFHEDLRQYKVSVVALFIVFLLSMATQVFRVLVVYTASLSLGLVLPLFYLILFIPIVFTVKMLPISIGGVGAREATFAVLFSWLGAAPEEGVLLGLTISALTTLYSMSGGIAYLCERPQPTTALSRAGALRIDPSKS